jgi:hypothetical protein
MLLAMAVGWLSIKYQDWLVVLVSVNTCLIGWSLM